MVKIEPTNRHDIHALVDHVPYNPPRMSAFLMRENKTFAEITRAKVITLVPVISANVLFSLYRDLTFMLRSWLS